MASEAQVNYILSLADKRDTNQASPELQAWLNTPLALENATNKEVNLLLEAIKGLPIKAPALTTEAAELAALEAKTMKGHYFITDPFDGVEKFYKIDKPEPPSRWTGYTFIKVQA